MHVHYILTTCMCTTYRWIYHDGLKQWWEKGAQDYLATLGMKDRQFKSLGSTNADCATYRFKLCGDTPEFMPLDNNLFADFKRALIANVCTTRHLPLDDPARFSLASPKKVFNAFERTWDHHPTSERIVQDILRFKESLKEVCYFHTTMICCFAEYFNNMHRSFETRGKP